MYELMIVDDEMYSRDGIASLIQRHYSEDFHVNTASDGADGLLVASNRSVPDVVLSDIRMPHMDGLEMARQLRGMNPDIILIFMSAYSELAYYKSALKMHALSFIEKPLIPEELFREMDLALETLRLRAAQSDAASAEDRARSSEYGIYIDEIKRIIKEKYMDPSFSIEQIAQRMHLSRNYVGNLFKERTGETITAYINQIRMEKAKALLSDPAYRISDVCALIGLDNPDYFTKRFKQYTGKTPSEYRR